MFKEIKEAISTIKEQLVLAEKLQQTKTDVAELRKDFDKLKGDFSVFGDKIQILLEKHFENTEKELEKIRRDEAREREILRLEIENELLKFQQKQSPKKQSASKSLPSGKTKK